MEKRMSNYRWRVVALIFFATSINYLDRQVIGLLKPTLEGHFHWSQTDYSHIIMSFQAAYALSLLAFGVIVDRAGTKRGYSISIVIWSVAAMLHAFAKSTNGFVLTRALLGLGEAGNFPAAVKVTTEWFPQKERALATGIFNAGANLGAVVAPIVVPWILGAYCWEAAFVLTGAVGFVWLVFWLIYFDIPIRQKRVNKEEFEYIHGADNEENQREENQTPVKWLDLFKIRQTWAFVVVKMLTDPIWWFFLFWLPSYFSETFKLDLSKPSLELMIIYTSSSVGSIGGGYLSGRMIKNGGMSAFRARKTAMLMFAIGITPIALAQFTTSAWQAVALISLAAAAHQGWSANAFTTVSDMFPKKAVSSVVGIGGMAGSVGGILFPMLAGHVLDSAKAAGNISAGYNVIFLICGSAYLVAWMAMHAVVPKMDKVNI